jgi:hypothetical protein
VLIGRYFLVQVLRGNCQQISAQPSERNASWMSVIPHAQAAKLTEPCKRLVHTQIVRNTPMGTHMNMSYGRAR